MKYNFFQHLQFSFYSTPFVCFKTVFTFYVASPKKKCAQSEVFFSLLGGVISHRPGKIINKKYKQNPGLRGAGGFKFNNLYLEALI